MGIPLIIVGAVLDSVNPAWFHGQYTVGDVCLWVGIGLTALTLLVFLFIVAAASGR